jgi:hypothetical protein
MLHVNRSLTTVAAALAAFTLAITIVAAKPAPRAAAEPLLTDGGPLVHGVNFMLKTVLDETFCIETDVAVSTAPSVYLAQCTGRPNQRWTFTDGEDGSSLVVGDRGFCLKVGHRPEPERLEIVACDYHADQRFKVTPAGLIMEKHSDSCLTVGSSTLSGVAIPVEECQDPIVAGQVWRLAM